MTNILSIANSGLSASKKALETTSHNIANANTEGYSRQRVLQSSSRPVMKNGVITGTGTDIDGVERFHDRFVEKRLHHALGDKEFHSGQFDRLSQVEAIFNEVDGDGLNKTINRFYNSFRELSNQPENETIRSVVRDNATLVVKDFNRIRESLDRQARNIDQELRTEIEDVNLLSKQISKVNHKIQVLEATGQETGDLRDERDLAIRELSKSFKITTYLNENDSLVVMAKGVGTIVSGTQFQELQIGSNSRKDSSNNMANSFEVYFKDRPSHPVTSSFDGGKIGAILKVRNKSIQNLQNKIDSIAFDFAKTTNAIHRKGYVNRRIKIDANGNPEVQDRKGKTTGINFFKEPTEAFNASGSLQLSDEVRSDLSNITTGIAPNAPGDNRVSIAISKLQHEKVLADGTATIEEDFLKTIGKIGIEAGKAKLNLEQSEGLLAQTVSIRERVSGVSIDEETANLVRYQQAYQASAKVMQAADEMFQTVLGIKR